MYGDLVAEATLHKEPLLQCRNRKSLTSSAKNTNETKYSTGNGIDSRSNRRRRPGNRTAPNTTSRIHHYLHLHETLQISIHKSVDTNEASLMTLPEVAIKVILAVDSAGVVPTSFCTLLVLGGNGNNRVDEICAFIPAIALALGEKPECAS